MSKKVLIIDHDEFLIGALRRLLAPARIITPVFCTSREAAAESLRTDTPRAAFINAHFGTDGDTHAGLTFACADIRLEPGISVQPEVIIYGFEPHERLRDFSLAEFGADLLTTPGFRFLRLPFTVEEFQAALAHAAGAAALAPEAIAADFRAVRMKLAEKLWREFEHDCRNLSQDAEGWNKLKEQHLPRFASEARRIEAGDGGLHARHRCELFAVVSDATPRFDALYDFLSGADSGRARELRRSQAVRSPTEGAPMLNEPNAAGRATIMVVDDDHDFGRRLSDDLAAMNHQVLLITDINTKTEQIVRRVGTNKVGVVLLDLKFGTVEKGFEILREIKAERPGTKVILMTGYGSESDKVVRAKSLGADDFVRKPISARSLAQRLEGLLVARRVLVIDDHLEEVATDDFVSRFSAAACLLYSYKDPGKALSDLESRVINACDLHLVLLDLKFGDNFERGFSAFKRLKELRRDLPIFIVTGHGSYDVIHDIAFNSLKSHFMPPRDNFMVKPLSEDHWTTIWAALFPDPEHLVLIPSKKRLLLLNAGGSVLAETKLPEKAFVLLHALALKRSRGSDTGIVPPGWEESSDDEDLRALKYYMWTGKEISEYRTELNAKIKQALRLDWELICRAADGTYALTPQIKNATVKS